MTFEAIRAAVDKEKCERGQLFFTRYFFRARQGIKLLVNWHHHYVADALEEVINGTIENLIITVPPGSTKTEMAVINFMARGLALNSRARFLHLSGSDSLASLNSATAREIVRSDEYQTFWPLQIADDAKAKKRWNVLVNGQPAGGVYATSLGGQVTGFRAGHMAPGFQGALIIDDPIKPEDAFSRVKLNAANRTLLTTVKSRKANPKTPVVMIMQRLAVMDPVGFVEAGNLPGKWKYITIPALIDEAYLRALPKKYQDMIEPSEKDDKGRFSYWPYKEPLQTLLSMERGEGTDAEGARISRFVFGSQYQQAPLKLGGNIIKGENFKTYKDKGLPKIVQRNIYADTAQKTKEHNDFSVFEEWGLSADNQIYLLDMVRGRWEGPELKKRAIAFWAKCKTRDINLFGQLRKMKVEDKSSGTDLIQTLKLPPHNIQIEGVERDKDKVTRVMDALVYIESGQVWVPEDAPFTNDFIAENESFTADDTHDFDDQVDPMLDAIMDLLSTGNKLNQWRALANAKETKTDTSKK